jgi:hypothetical protein
MREEFIESIIKHQIVFGLNLTDDVISVLADYYELVQDENPLLHLVAPCLPKNLPSGMFWNHDALNFCL